MDEIDAIASQGGLSKGVPTGFTELDELTQGLHPGRWSSSRRGPVWEGPGPGHTASDADRLDHHGRGSRRDHLIGADGRPTRVVAATGSCCSGPATRSSSPTAA